MGFAASGFVRFMAGPAGRIIRIVAGLALLVWGLADRAGIPGAITAAVGVLGLLTGVLNVCVVSALLGGPFRGSRIRDSKPRTKRDS